MKGHTARVPAIAMLATLAMLKFEFTQVHMGVTVRLTLFASNQSKALAAAKTAFARFAQLDSIMSDYQQNSELNRLCRVPANQWTNLSPDLYAVLERARRVSVLSGGAFDVTAGPNIRLWRAARQSKVLPGGEAIQSAIERTGFRLLELRDGQASLKKDGMQLDLGGIAKGYACDAALKKLSEAGVDSAMVEAGGDIAVSGPPPGTHGWTISILDWPNEKVSLVHKAISTSGDSEQFVEFEGVRYSHVVDPRTGWALRDSRQATVVGSLGWLTDALATTFCVLSRSEAEALAEELGVRVWLRESTRTKDR